MQLTKLKQNKKYGFQQTAIKYKGGRAIWLVRNFG